MRYERFRVMDATEGRHVSFHKSYENAMKQVRHLERNTDNYYTVVHYEWELFDVHVVYGQASDGVNDFAQTFEAVKSLLLEEDFG